MKTKNCNDPQTPRAMETEHRRKLASDLRDAEWETAQELLATARSLLRRIVYREPRKTSLTEISRMLDIASKLGRLATGLAVHPDGLPESSAPRLDDQWERALEKVYGHTSETVEVEQPRTLVDTPQPSDPPQ